MNLDLLFNSLSLLYSFMAAKWTDTYGHIRVYGH